MLLKKLRPLFVFCVFAFAAAARAEVAIEHWQTVTGAKVYFVHSAALPILDVQLDFAAGAIFDPPEKAGLAASVGALLEMGAGAMTETEISDHLADVGAQLASGVEDDLARVSLRTLTAPEKMGAALDVLETILRQPHFAADVFERERARGIAAIKDALTRPGPVAQRAFRAALYPGHPYGNAATPESLAAIRHADLQAFWRARYGAANAVVSIVGNLQRPDAEALAERLAAALPPADSAALPALPAPPMRVKPGVKQRLPHPSSTQAHIYLGLPAISKGDPDFFPLLVGNYILGGGGFVSRLMTEVREKRGYAYSVYSYFSPMKQDGPFTIGLQTRKEQADEALRVTRQVLEQFLADGPTAAELAAAKAYLAGSFPLNLDSNRKILSQIANIGFYNLPLDYLAQYPSRVRAVTLPEIRAAFARHVAMDRLAEVIVGAEEE
ncbi:MAG: insulinase family protein [Zoogloeaceae bacterium]|jgi:zinc protease|nr:insulinase family protein [Zoogloeaceae bacterium]